MVAELLSAHCSRALSKQNEHAGAPATAHSVLVTAHIVARFVFPRDENEIQLKEIAAHPKINDLHAASIKSADITTLDVRLDRDKALPFTETPCSAAATSTSSSRRGVIASMYTLAKCVHTHSQSPSRLMSHATNAQAQAQALAQAHAQASQAALPPSESRSPRTSRTALLTCTRRAQLTDLQINQSTTSQL